MDEITLVNLLNKICEHTHSLDWKLNCNYHNGLDTTIMKVLLFDTISNEKKGQLTFKMETATLIGGKYVGLVPFSAKVSIVDALLEILYFESSQKMMVNANN